jgi:pimeloyl-ACP methyl ester carboxylesterase
VLAVHGVLLDGRLWDTTAEALAGRVRLVLPDLPLGAHRTPVPDRDRLTPVEIAGGLVDIVDQLGLDRPVLLGNDTGGALAQIAAARHPQRFGGLVLAGCDAFGHFPPPLIRPFVAAAAAPWLARAAVRLLTVRPLLADPGPLNIFTARGFGRDLTRSVTEPSLTDPAILADLRAFLRSVSANDLMVATGGLGAFRGRAAVVWGRRDVVFPTRDARLLAEILGTEVQWLDDARTFVPLDRPDAVAEAVTRVLGRAVDSAAP